jgi:hypothetical protein
MVNAWGARAVAGLISNGTLSLFQSKYVTKDLGECNPGCGGSSPTSVCS